MKEIFPPTPSYLYYGENLETTTGLEKELKSNLDVSFDSINPYYSLYLL
jgi:hypothetical protein